MSTDQLVEIVLDVDLDKEPECGSSLHTTDRDHSGPGAFWQRTPCGHHNGIRCASYVAAVLEIGWLHCDDCGFDRPHTDYRFIEL